MKTLTFITIALLPLFAGCWSKGKQIPDKSTSDKHREATEQFRAKSQFITVKDGRFIDPEGREIILHGTNISDKSKQHDYLSWHGPEEFAKMQGWGFNCIRLSIFWDGVEPEPGRYDDEYLAGVDKRIQWAKENRMYVLLDMHQDLFSAAFGGGGDGAPAWATLDDGKPHIRGGSTWSIAYFTSPAVHTAFDNFWANKPVPDGIGIQDHFARAWRHVAERYADEPAVVGFDLFNEPFTGSLTTQAMMLKLQAMGEAIAQKRGGEPPNILALAQNLTKPGGDTSGLMNNFDDMGIFNAFVDAGALMTTEFDRTTLASFYNRVAGAIRQVDKNHLIFITTNLLSNLATPSGVVPIVNSAGDRDPHQAFAPHGYDIVTDTPNVANASAERIKIIYARHAETAKRLGMPALVGEWGAFYGQPNTLAAAQMVVAQIEKHLFSDTYWSYSGSREMEDAPYFPVIARLYPTAIAGTLLHYQSDFESKTLRCAWKEDPTVAMPSRIYLSARWFPEGYSVDLKPKAKGWSFEATTAAGSSGYLVIPPTGQEVERRLNILR